MSDNIKVVVKVRPLISRENSENFSHRWEVDDNTLVLYDNGGKKATYTFDKVYNAHTKTQDVYNDVAKPIVEAFTTGINGTIFAYGQTSSGKTYTMMGTDDSPGIIKLAVLHLFDIIKATEDRDFLIRVSYMEIYNDDIKDLLDIENTKKIKILDKPQGGVCIKVKEEVTRSPEEIFKFMEQGEANRHIGATNMNEKSSRSHTIFQITIESTEHATNSAEVGSVNVSQLNLVDLAGSERPATTGATNERFVEGTFINKSLSTLTLVIKQLSELKPGSYVNYRDSKLTRLLQHSLGGNAKTSIICAVTPAAQDETVSTLQFALRAKDIKNKPTVNEVVTQQAQDTKIHLLNKKIAALQAALDGKRNVEVMLEQDNQKLQLKLKTMQSQILTGPILKKPAQAARDRRRTWCAPRAEPDAHLADAAEPRFATPALKYNPLSLQQTSFIPITSRTPRLNPVPEEGAVCALSPPLITLDISGEIINIDSNDEEEVSQRESSCSPYHQCYAKRGTPPCILRDRMNKAEQEKIEIIELTEREKIFPPAVNELLPKLEENTRIIKQLQDKVNSTEDSMKSLQQEKNKLLEENTRIIKQLQDKVNSTEDSMKSLEQEKATLKFRCDELQSLMTDMEVSYETLKTKSKIREEELLSLLENQEVHHKPNLAKNQCLEKELSSFMNLSKDLSLVSSDNENSIVVPSDDLQLEINEKNATIEQLKADLQLYKNKVLSLESTVQFHMNDKERFIVMETKNIALASDIETLNKTIKSLKDNLEIAHADIDSYKAIVKDLQLRKSEKSGNLTQEIVENLCTNEKKISANNENIQNVIETLHNAVNKCNGNSDHEKYDKIINEKDELIAAKQKDIMDLNNQLDNNIKEINHLNTEKDNLTTRIVQLNDDLSRLSQSAQDDKYKIQQLTDKLDEILSLNASLEKHTVSKLYLIRHKIIEVIAFLKGGVHISVDDIEDVTQTFESFNLIMACLEEASKDAVSEDIKTQLTSLKDKYEIDTKILKTEINQLKESLNVTITGNDNLKLVNVKLNQEIHGVRQALIDIEGKNSELKQELNVVNNKLQCETKNLDESKDVINSLNANLELQNSLYNQKIEEIRLSLNEENETLKAEMQTLNDNLQLKINSLFEIIRENKSMHDIANQRNSELCQELDEIRQNLLIISEEKNIVEEEMSDLKSSLIEVQKELQQKICEIDSLKESASSSEMTEAISCSQLNSSSTDDIKLDVSELLSACKREKDTLNQLLIEKENEILHLKQSEITLREKGGELVEQLKLATTCILHKEEFAKNIHRIVNDITAYCQISGNVQSELSEEDYLQVIYRDLAEIAQYMKTRTDTTSHEDREEIQARVLQLSNDNENLKKIIVELETHKSLVANLKMENDNLKIAIVKFEKKQQSYDDVINAIYNENSVLTSNLTECKDLLQVWTQNAPQSKSNVNSPESLNVAENIENKNTDCINNSVSPKAKEPKTLNSLCYGIIREVLIKDIEPIASPFSNDFTPECEKDASHDTRIKINELQSEKNNLERIIEFLRSANKNLIEEKEDARKEIQLLMESIFEMDKKIASHRTNLSTLTATTYAENKMLKTKVKVLQYHHSRLHNVCRNYLPAIRTELTQLQNSLLKDPDLLNSSIKRYSLPDVFDTISSSFVSLNNNTTLDGDALMLDSNFTLNASMDNTLIEEQNTLLDSAQACLDSETTCHDATFDPQLQNDLDALVSNNQKMAASLRSLQEENLKLKQIIEEHSSTTSVSLDLSPCKNCIGNSQLQVELADALARLAVMQEELLEAEEKYKNLELDVPSSENLMIKITALERELASKLSETDNLNEILSTKTAKNKDLQLENDNLSTQIMDIITEVDDLKKKVEELEEVNKCLENRCIELEMKTDKDAVMRRYQNSMSEKELVANLDSSSRYNKICSLQNELLASKEDSKKITEEVATIKNHLDRSDFSLQQNMDDTMEESNIFFFSKKHDSENAGKIGMCNVSEERVDDPFISEKRECVAYYSETTDTQKENLDRNVKVIDLMKMLHHKLTVSYSNEVENLNNRLRQFEYGKKELEEQMVKLQGDHIVVTRELEQSRTGIDSVTKHLDLVRTNIDDFKLNVIPNANIDNNSTLMSLFKDNILHLLDKEFSLTIAEAFESLANKISTKHQIDLAKIMEQYMGLQNHMENINVQLTTVKENLNSMETQLLKKEEDYNLLKTQKERVHEISQAVTLDIVKRELELSKTLKKGYESLIANNIIKEGDIDISLPTTQILNVMFERVVEQNTNLVKTVSIKDLQEKEANALFNEMKSIKAELQQRENELSCLKAELKEYTEKHASSEHESKILLQNLEQEIHTLKQSVLIKDRVIKDISESQIKETAQKEIENIKILKSEVETLRTANEILAKEKYAVESELSEAAINIAQLKQDFELKSVEVKKLAQEIGDNVTKINTITAQSEELMKQVNALRSENASVSATAAGIKQDYENNCQALAQLQANIKTHEKTAIIQTGIINRLQKQKEEADTISVEKDLQLQKLKAKNEELAKELEDMKLKLASAAEEMDSVKIFKDSLETRVSELEGQASRPSRASLEARGRRRSQHDAGRALGDACDHDDKVEAVFAAREQPDDLFMDVDGGSGRSSPSRHTRRRDSFLGKEDQTGASASPPSRPGSVCAARRRRQSAHDLHRSALHASPRESLLGTVLTENLVANCSDNSELVALRGELEELRARCRELDEECDACAEHLRDADDVCARLKREKTALENTVADLLNKLKNYNPRDSDEDKPEYVNAAVNTDQDWANLHSVVVDRMSYDAEVEKTRRLTRAVEEFHVRNRELKAAVHRLERQLAKAKSGSGRELESCQQELQTAQQELAALRQQYRELDEECETCARYLHERDEQCRLLKAAKEAAELKLRELSQSPALSSARKKRQSLHDALRDHPVLVDAATDTEDLPRVEDREPASAAGDAPPHGNETEVKKLSAMVHSLSREKAALERRLRAPSPTFFVATGSAIVQNQQMTDVMKENQKLKKTNAKLIALCKKRGKSCEEEQENIPEQA